MSALPNPSQQHSSAIPTGEHIPPPIGETSSSDYQTSIKPSTGYTGVDNDASFNPTATSPVNPFTSGSGNTTTSSATTNTSAGSGTAGAAGGVLNTGAADKTSICYLLTWKDPIHTGKVFGSIVFGLLIFKSVNLVNIFFHASYVALLLSAAAEYVGKLLTGKGFVTNYFKQSPTAKSSYSEKFNKEFLPTIADLNTQIEKQVKKVVFAQDIESTLKAAGISYILYKVTSFVSLYSLFIFAIGFFFTVPYIYTTYQKEIDAAVGKYTSCAKAKVNKTLDDLCPHVHGFFKQLGPIGQAIEKKLPVRTAGSTVGNSRATSYGTAADQPIPASSSSSSSKPTGISSGVSSGSTQPTHKTTGTTTGHSFPSVGQTKVSEGFENDTDDFADTTQGSKF